MPTIVYRGGKYEGDVENGVPHGRGVLTYSRTGHKYEGEWRNGKAHGRGVATGVVNETVEQEIQAFYKQNKKKINIDYSVKENTSNESPTTQNPLVPRGHFRYEGTWEDDEMSGQGVFTFPNGDIYDGDWKNDEPNGNGMYCWAATGDKYLGSFQKMHRSGVGSYLFFNGNRYEGNWFQDMKNGKGTETFANGNKFDGYWVRDMRHGEALYFVHLNNIDRKVAKKRRASVHKQQSSKKSAAVPLINLSDYVVYHQTWEYNKKISEKELQPTDELPTLNPPSELASGSIEDQLELLDKESPEVEEQYAKFNELFKNDDDEEVPKKIMNIMDEDNVFVQGLILWLPNYWKMIEADFVNQYRLKEQLQQARTLLDSFSDVREMKNEKATLVIKTDRLEEALTMGKEDMRDALVDICGVEPPPDNMVEDIFRMKLEVQITQMKEQIQTLDTEIAKKIKSISKETEEELEQRVEDLQKKVGLLDSRIEMAKIHSASAGTTVDTSPVQYQDLVAQVVTHLKRLRVLLKRILNAPTTEEREKNKKLCKSESTLFQDLVKRRAAKLEDIHVDVSEVCSRSQGLTNLVVFVKIE